MTISSQHREPTPEDLADSARQNLALALGFAHPFDQPWPTLLDRVRDLVADYYRADPARRVLPVGSTIHVYAGRGSGAFELAHRWAEAAGLGPRRSWGLWRWVTTAADQRGRGRPGDRLVLLNAEMDDLDPQLRAELAAMTAVMGITPEVLVNGLGFAVNRQLTYRIAPNDWLPGQTPLGRYCTTLKLVRGVGQQLKDRSWRTDTITDVVHVADDIADALDDLALGLHVEPSAHPIEVWRRRVQRATGFGPGHFEVGAP